LTFTKNRPHRTITAERARYELTHDTGKDTNELWRTGPDRRNDEGEHGQRGRNDRGTAEDRLAAGT
jgi:hypothetical protein